MQGTFHPKESERRRCYLLYRCPLSGIRAEALEGATCVCSVHLFRTLLITCERPVRGGLSEAACGLAHFIACFSQWPFFWWRCTGSGRCQRSAVPGRPPLAAAKPLLWDAAAAAAPAAVTAAQHTRRFHGFIEEAMASCPACVSGGSCVLIVQLVHPVCGAVKAST